MGEEMKTIENGEQSSIEETAGNEEIKNGEHEKSEWEKQFEELLHKTYLRGVSTGGKAFVGSVYQIILDGKKDRMNAAKILIKVEAACKRMLDVADNYQKKDKEESQKEDAEITSDAQIKE